MISLRSNITAKLLSFFFLNPHESLYVNEIAEKLSLDKRNLVKKLRELEKEGILSTLSRGNLKFYSINRGYPLYKEYRSMILKTLGLEAKLKKILCEIQGIEKAYIYGSYAKDTMDAHSDIDLLVIGRHDSIALQRRISKIQREAGREINVVNMDAKEFERRKKKRDPFLSNILANKRIELLG